MSNEVTREPTLEQKQALERAEIIRDYLAGLDPNFKSVIVPHDEGGYMIQGPFPTLMVTVGFPSQTDGYLTSVNADGPTVTFLVHGLLRQFPGMINYGAFSEALEEGGPIVVGPEAYELKEQHHVLRALQIMQQRKMLDQSKFKGDLAEKELIVPSKELILPN